MDKSNESTEFGLKCGSMGDAVAASAFPLTPGKKGCGSVALAGGSGATFPSFPIRNAFVALRDADDVAQVPLERTNTQLTGWMRPGLSSGPSTKPTPFKRP